MMNDRPIACNLAALDEMEQRRRAELAARLRAVVRKILPSSNGYAFHLAASGNTFSEIAEFVALEQRCCPFLNFEIEPSDSGDSISVRLSGGEGVKEFLAAEFDIPQTD